MKQIAQEQKYILLIAPVRRGRPQQSMAEGKAFPFSGIIAGNTNLQMDLLARSLGDEVFNDYVDGMYDSSADYWRVHEDGTISWDGHLNFYKDCETDINDAKAGLIKGNEDLDKIITDTKKEGKTKINLGGVEVDVSRLKEIKNHNERIVDSGKTLGLYNSYSSYALLSDGFMSYEEATISEKSMFARSSLRMYEKTAEAIASKFLFSAHDPFSELEGIKSFLDAVSPNMIEHYSTRYVLNQNDEFKNTFENMPYSTFKNWTTRKNNKIDNYFGDPATLLPPYIQRAVDTHNRLLLEDKNYSASCYLRSRNYMYH